MSTERPDQESWSFDYKPQLPMAWFPRGAPIRNHRYAEPCPLTQRPVGYGCQQLLEGEVSEKSFSWLEAHQSGAHSILSMIYLMGFDLPSQMPAADVQSGLKPSTLLPKQGLTGFARVEITGARAHHRRCVLLQHLLKSTKKRP